MIGVSYIEWNTQPIGVGYSYGTQVNNSRDAAFDVYDFLQKFYKLYPHLAKYVSVMQSMWLIRHLPIEISLFSLVDPLAE